MAGMLEVRRGAAVLTQMQHLGAPIQDTLHAAIQWRILFPAIGKAMTAVGLPPASVFIGSYLGAFAVVAYLVHIFRRRHVPWLQTTAAVLILSASTWWFASACWLGYFDSWIIFALLVVLFAGSAPAIYAACLLAPWIDERFIIGAALALALRNAAPAVPSPPRADARAVTPTPRADACAVSPTPRADACAVDATPSSRFSLLGGTPPLSHPTRITAFALLAAFALVRLFLLPTAPAATPAGYLHAQHLATTPGTILLALWESLRASWLFLILGIITLRRRWLAAAAVLLLIVLALATAQDFARSLELLFPFAALGAVLTLAPVEAAPSPLSLPYTNQFLLPAATVAALLLPAHQVMSDRITPIFYLYHELNTLHNPPASASPSFYELRGILAMERGDLAQANADLSLAIQLSPDPASPAQQRGVLYASHGRWPDAQKDFTTVITAEPQNPEGWFFRAQSDLALNQPVEARQDFHHALAVAGPDFTARPDVQRFQQKLAP